MRLLDRYLLRELLVPLAYCLVGFLVCFIVFDVFQQVSNFQDKELNLADIAEYYLDRIPELLVTSYLLPMSLLLGLLYALTNHARHNELTAMRAAGIPLWRISLPYLGVGVLFSVVVLVLNERVIPDSSEAAEQVLVRRAPNQPKAVNKIWARNVFFMNPVAKRAWQISAYNIRARLMIAPHVQWPLPDGGRIEISAERARWQNRQWVFTNVQQLIYSAAANAIPTNIRSSTLVSPEITETPRIIKSEITVSALDNWRSLRKTHLSSAEILDYLRLHPGLDTRRSASLRTLLHSRLAAPWTCFVVVLIAIPFGSLSGRRNVFVGVASSVFICFVFLIAKDLALALGSGGYVPPPLAAWLPNAMFAATGMALIWRGR